jgi:hypothetical protein
MQDGLPPPPSAPASSRHRSPGVRAAPPPPCRGAGPGYRVGLGRGPMALNPVTTKQTHR